MNQLSVCAHAKINLTLDVTGRREDGYHLVSMVMQSIGLHDLVTVSAHTGTDRIEIVTNRPDLPTDRGNLCYRAAELFFSETGCGSDGIAIKVEKHIPVAAGLAGGSTNAAAVLALLDRLYGTALGEERLCAMGLKLGADVPFCLCGGTMLAEGIGERLTRLPDAPQTVVVLCKPPEGVSTPMIYKAIDRTEIAVHPDNPAMLCAIEAGDAGAVAGLLENVMQPVTGGMRPEVLEIRQTLLDFGADGAVMSGSGPSTFGLFSDRDAAERCCARLKETYPDTFVTDFSTASLTDFR